MIGRAESHDTESIDARGESRDSSKDKPVHTLDTGRRGGREMSP